MLLTVDLERLEVGPGDLVLDAGCGEGRHCFGCLERGARVIGLDLDLPSMRDASKRLRGRAAELDTVGESVLHMLIIADTSADDDFIASGKAKNPAGLFVQQVKIKIVIR